MPDLWPFRPELGCAETLEWYSEVLGSRTGEQRLSLRPAPRQTLSYGSRLLDEQQFARAKVFARRNGALPVYVPHWGEQVAYGVVGSGDSVLTFDTTTGDWRVGSFLVVWEDDQNYAVCEIAARTASTITLTDNVGQAFTHAVICPVRTALMMQGLDVSRGKVHSDVSVSFSVTDNIDLAASYVTPYPQYQGLDVMIEAPRLVTDVSETIVRAADYIDNGFGPIAVETLRNYADFGQTIVFHDERPDLWQRRLWLHSLRGKQQCFWFPSFNRDLVLQAAVSSGSTTISVASIGPSGYYINKHIAIERTDGVRHFRQISNAASAGGGIDNLTISSALGISTPPADVNMISFMTVVRLDSDSVDIQHSYELCSVISIPVIETLDVADGGGGGDTDWTPTPPPTSSSDPNFGNVVLLVGAGTDESGHAHPLTAAGEAQVSSSSQSKFGGTSIYLDGVGDYISLPDSIDWDLSDLNSDQFTIEAWIRPLSTSGAIVGQDSGDGTISWVLWINVGQLTLYYSPTGTYAGLVGLSSPTLIAINTWYHVACTKDAGGTIRLYVNGSRVAFTTPTNSTFFNSSAPLRIGQASATGSNFAGYIDELRITKGAARYTTETSFTVPAAAFPRS